MCVCILWTCVSVHVLKLSYKVCILLLCFNKSYLASGKIRRSDIWHFMRRIAAEVTSKSHPLYGLFMSKLSACIFEWEIDDYMKLRDAKKGQLLNSGVYSPSTEAVINSRNN